MLFFIAILLCLGIKPLHQNLCERSSFHLNGNQRLRSAGNGRLKPPRRFMYCLGCLFVTALTPLTSLPATGFPFVESNPTGIPNIFIISNSPESISTSGPPPSGASFWCFCCCSLTIPSTKSDTTAAALCRSLSPSSSPCLRRFRDRSGEGVRLWWRRRCLSGERERERCRSGERVRERV